MFKEIRIQIIDFLRKYGMIIFIFLFLPYYVLIPLFEYETWPSGHDSSGTVYNAWSMVKILWEDFHFPINWQVENFSFNGNPYWAFYQPLSYFMIFIVSIFTSLFGKDYLFGAMKGAVFVSFLLSEIGMFFLLKTILKDSPTKNLISTFGAIVYLLAPYRFIDLYSRNAYSEVWVFPWTPFYLLGFYKLFFLKEKNGWILIALSTGCLFLSHLMPSFFFIMITHLGFLIFLLIKKDLIGYTRKNKKIIFWWLIANVVGVGIASFYIFPALINIGYLMGDNIGFDRINLQHVLDHISWCFNMLDPLNFKGAWQVGQLFLLSVIVLNLFLFTNRELEHKNLLMFLNVCVLVTFIFLMSKTLWEHLPKLFYSLQFSWRLFFAYSVYGSIIVALLANELKLKIPILLIMLAFHFYTGERFLHFGGGDVVVKHYDGESWLNEINTKHYTTCNGGGYAQSFLPKTSFPLFFNFMHADELGKQEKYSNSYLLNVKPGTKVLSKIQKGNTFIYNLNLEKPSFLIFKQFYYPTWKLYIDSKRSNEIYLTEQGYIGFEVPKGKHEVTIKTL